MVERFWFICLELVCYCKGFELEILVLGVCIGLYLKGMVGILRVNISIKEGISILFCFLWGWDLKIECVLVTFLTFIFVGDFFSCVL